LTTGRPIQGVQGYIEPLEPLELLDINPCKIRVWKRFNEGVKSKINLNPLPHHPLNSLSSSIKGFKGFKIPSELEPLPNPY